MPLGERYGGDKSDLGTAASRRTSTMTCRSSSPSTFTVASISCSLLWTQLMHLAYGAPLNDIENFEHPQQRFRAD
ncbi:UNVERIFIED_CONTAM: hypothetical protein Sindi_1500800 [Sesamum indicum]